MDPESSVRIGIDTGGTFTDVIVWSGGSLETFKLPSTPDDPSQAILDGIGLALDRVGRGGTAEVVHGTTVGTNALLERKGARTALVSTLGFEDVLAIRRQARPELYNLGVRAAPPLLGEHTAAILHDELGYLAEEIDELRNKRVI